MSEDIKVTDETTETQTKDVNDETAQSIDDSIEEQSGTQEQANGVEEGSVETGLDEKITELEDQLNEKENRYLRLYADFENFRRRTKKDQEAGEKYRAQNLITNLLPAIDNFERAMQIEVDNEQAKSLLEGVEMVYRAIIDALKQEGAQQIEAVGKEFDPNLHQAVMQTEDDQYGSNIVVEEYQKGYILNDRVIRPSMVRVNK